MEIPIRRLIPAALFALILLLFGALPFWAAEALGGTPLFPASRVAASPGTTADEAAPEALIPLPVGRDVFQLRLNQTGLYEITRADLVAAGLNPGINPNTIQLIHRGKNVAYQWIGNGDSIFDSGEKIRFYGWPFTARWEEKQYVNDNVYWLWAGGTATRLSTPGSAIAGSTVITTHTAVVRTEVDDLFSSTKVNMTQWQNKNTDPDSMYWMELLRTANIISVTKSLTVSLPNQSSLGASAIFTTALVAEGRGLFPATNGFISGQVSNDPVSKTVNFLTGTGSWGTPFLFTQTIPVSALTGNVETVVFTHTAGTDPAQVVTVLVNHVTAQYLASLTAIQDQIHFSHTGTGSLDYRINGFSTTNPAAIAFWDITDPYLPKATSARYLSGGGGNATFGIGLNQTGTKSYLVAADPAAKKPQIAKYSVPNIEPAGGRADWVAIAPASLITPANTLASHRAAASGLTTHVITASDVFNQYGYGFPTPQAIKAYLQHAFDDWTSPPGYVVLLGDGQYNPRGLPCTQCDEGNAPGVQVGRSNWTLKNEALMPFNYAFEDRFQGLIPSDHAYTLLSGGDLRPDIAIGRISARTAAEAAYAVNKIIRYELNLQNPQDWHNDLLFIHDENKNPGDDFLGDVNQMLVNIPDSYDKIVVGYTGPKQNPDPVQAAMIAKMNSGVAMVNYRGHGSIDSWSGNQLLTSSLVKQTPDPLNNLDRPFISLSMDCLDGNFAYPGWDSLSETLMRQDNRGSAAHWSSTGLGFPFEHDILAKHFYLGLFSVGYSAIGDVVKYAKTQYDLEGFDKSELYAFTLQGDPAMQVYKKKQTLYLPIINR